MRALTLVAAVWMALAPLLDLHAADDDLFKARTPKTATVAGIALEADGHPAANAVVLDWPAAAQIPLLFAMLHTQWFEFAKCDMDGHFRIDFAPGRHKLAVVSADLKQATFSGAVAVGKGETKEIRLNLQPFGQIRGHVISSKIERFANTDVVAATGPPQTMEEAFGQEEPDPWAGCVAMSKTDGGGAFLLTGLLPGRYIVYLSRTARRTTRLGTDNEMAELLQTVVTLSNSEQEVTLGGKYPGIVRGRAVYGGENMASQEVQLLPWSGTGVPAFTDRPSFETLTDTNGTFEFIDVPTGSYLLMFLGRAQGGEGLRARTVINVGDQMPTMIDLRPETLNKLHAHGAPKIGPGDPAPDFEVRDSEGRPLKLSTLRGKVVLLVFWATWCGPCRSEVPYLKKVAEVFRRREDFALVSISLDDDETKWREFIGKRGMTWLQGLNRKDKNGSAAARYHVEGVPSQFLIGRDGKILRNGVPTSELLREVRAALDFPGPPS